MFCRKLKVLSALLLLTVFSARVFAVEEYVSDIYRQIDNCFTVKDEGKLNDVLSKNTKDKYYYLIENYLHFFHLLFLVDLFYNLSFLIDY